MPKLRNAAILLLVLVPADVSHARAETTIRGKTVGFFSSLAQQGSYPFRLIWNNPGRAVAGAGVIAGLVALDPIVHEETHEGLAVLRPWGEKMARYGEGTYMFPVVAAFGLAGIVGNSREADTAVLLGESVVSAGVWTSAIKEVSRRTRPRETAESDGDWNGPGFVFAEDPIDGHSLQSFPSGHSSMAWATATVLAHQYPAHHIIPVVAYLGAAAMSYSRMVVDAHWLSDVAVGGAIGFGCAREIIGRRESLDEEKVGNPNPLNVYLDIENGHREIGLDYRL